jgi:hypothetical protein
MKPNDVRPEHSDYIFQKLFPPKTLEANRKDEQTKRRVLEQLTAGDHVRLLEYRTTFRKESDLAWTNEVFRVRRVVQTDPITFKIEDLNGEAIKGGFYFEELIKVRPSDNELHANVDQEYLRADRRYQETEELERIRGEQ